MNMDGLEPPGPGRPPLVERLRAVTIDVTPLRLSRDFRYLYFGSFVSFLGSRLTFVAIPYQVYRLTGSTIAVGLLGLCELVPLLVLSLLGGAIADAVDRRKLLIITESLSAVITAGLALNATGSDPQLWVIYSLTTAIAAMYALGAPAFRSLTPLFVKKEHLPAAGALAGVSQHLSSVAGPVAAGVLIGVVGLPGTFLIDALSFTAVLIAVWTLHPIRPHEDAPRSSVRSVFDGIRYLKGRPVLRGSFVVDIIAMVLGMPLALFPAVADRLGGAQVLGLLYAAPSAGALIASLTSGWTGRMHRHGIAVYLSVMGWGAALIVFGLSDSLWLTLVALAVAGGSDMISAIFRHTILQVAAPANMIGRLSGLELAVVASGPALGDLEASILAALTTIRTSIVAGGISCIVGVLLMWVLSPAFAAYDARDPTP